MADCGLGSDPSDPSDPSAIRNPPSAIRNEEVLDLLTSLLDKSLVQYEERAGERRYRLLQTIRQYGRERLEEAGDAAAVHVRHCNWFLSLAERAEPELWGPRQVEWLERLEREHDNLRAALAWCRTSGVQALRCSGVEEASPERLNAQDQRQSTHPQLQRAGTRAGYPPGARNERREGWMPPEHLNLVEIGLRLGGALWRFWELRGYFGEGREHLVGLLAPPGADAPTAVRARALRSAGVMAHYQGDCGAVRAYCEEALAIFREVGDRSGIAWSLGYLRWEAAYRGDHEKARALAEESLAAFREAGDPPGIAWALISLTWAVAQQGEYGAARALAEESLRISREIGYKEGIAWSLGALGDLAHYEGEYSTARALYEESLPMLRELGSKFGIAVWLFDLGEVCRAQGDYRESRALHRESLAMCRQQGSKRLIARNLEALAAVAIEQTEYERAARLHGAAEGLRAANGDAPFSLAPAAYERSITNLRAAMGEKAFAAAWAEGQGMRLEDAIACALQDGAE
jgi:tetratricopeptide (TPR) repeat protein